MHEAGGICYFFGMRRQPPPSFEQLEADARQLVHSMVNRDACPCCISRALLFAAMELAYGSNTLPQVRETLQSLLNERQQDASEPLAH